MSSLDRFSSESDFEAKILTDIIAFLLSNTGNRRFLTHAILEKYMPSYGLLTFSVGKDERRRVVLCKTDPNIRFDPKIPLPSFLENSTPPLSELSLSFSNIPPTEENISSETKFQNKTDITNRKKSLDKSKPEDTISSKLTVIDKKMNDTENKKQAVPVKRRAVESYYVPPPLRKLNPKNEESLRERARPVKHKVNTKDTTKACNDSSLLFQEDEANQFPRNHKVKTKSLKTVQKSNIGSFHTEEQEPPEVRQHHSKEEVPQVAQNEPPKAQDEDPQEEKSQETIEITVKQKESDKTEAPKAPRVLPNVVLTLGDYRETVPEPIVEKIEKPLPIKETVKPKKKSDDNTSTVIPKTSNKPPKNLFTEVDDWESLYDLADDSLTYEEIEEITGRVGKINILHANENYSDFADPSTQEVGTIIEIYGFREEIKTSDLIAIFGSYASRGFNLKWVDDTHALGIFASSRLAEEVLNTDLPMVKTRPLHRASPQSRSKAKSLVLPSTLRPKTCTSLARRLVSGALGVKVTVTPEKIAAEKELLREAREVKRRAAKDRDAAWEGNFPSSQ